MIYKEETGTTELWEEVYPILEEHKEEISILKNAELNFSFRDYMMLYIQGKYKFYSVRTDEEELVGYATYFITPHPHYLDYLTAQQDVLYISKKHRKGVTGIKLIKFSEKELKKLGVNLILQHSKLHYNLSKLFERLGYTECDVIHSKEI